MADKTTKPSSSSPHSIPVEKENESSTKKRKITSKESTNKRQRTSGSSSSGHLKKEFTKKDLQANLIRMPKDFESQEQIETQIGSWKSEGESYKHIVREMGRILLAKDETLDADLTEIEAQQLFPSDLPYRAQRLTSPAYLRILRKIAPNNEVEWLAELHHPIQECFKEFITPDNESIIAESFGNAVIAQTTTTDQRLKPDRVFGWSSLKSRLVTRWVGTIQFPFIVIQSKPASMENTVGDLFKMKILEAKAYEHQEDCIRCYKISPDHQTTICLPLVFGMYLVGSKISFDVYRVIDGAKKPVSFKPIDYIEYPKRVLRAIIAIKTWVRQLRDNMINIDTIFDNWYSEEEDEGEGEGDGDGEGEDEDKERLDMDYQDEQGSQPPSDEQDQKDKSNNSDETCIELHQSSKTSVVAKYDKQRGCYIVFKTTVARDGIQEAKLLQRELTSLSFVPRLLDIIIEGNEATLTMSWHAGQHPQGFTSHQELKQFLTMLLQNVNRIHKQGIVHNDLKEANLLWDTNSLIVIDFGGAARYPSTSTIGTRGYMAPDTIRTHASDVYSCGVIFFNLLLNIRICSSEQVVYLRQCNSIEDISERIAPFLPVNTSLWHSGAWELAKRMTDPNPSKRITLKRALQHAYLL